MLVVMIIAEVAPVVEAFATDEFDLGVKDVANVSAGLLAFVEAKIDAVKGPPVIALESNMDPLTTVWLALSAEDCVSVVVVVYNFVTTFVFIRIRFLLTVIC